MVKTSSLLLVAISFGAGFLFGFSWHHIIDAHAEETKDVQAGRRGGSDQWARFEARLAALEQARGAKQEAASPVPEGTVVRSVKKRASHHFQPEESKHQAVADPTEDEAATPACPKGRKPYHLLLTAQDSPYQAWQTRIMYYHFKKLQAANPCSEMTGFTRMLNSDGSKPDALMDEMPTVVVGQLDRGSGCHDSDQNTCDMGFPVMNRPHGVTQLLAKLDAGELPQLTEEYVLIAETDHVFMSEPKNLATPSKPVCFPFGYMNAKAATLRPVVQRFVDDPDKAGQPGRTRRPTAPRHDDLPPLISGDLP